MAGGHTNIEISLDASHAGWRLDRALAAAVPSLSRERLKVLTKAGALTREGKALRDPATKVKGDEHFTLAVPDPTPAHNEPQEIPLPIVFEDEHLLVVDKPAGLVVHPAAGNRDGTLVNALLHHCGGSLSGIGGVARPGIVHRIDKDTSGLLVVAKHDKAHEGLAKQFADHSIDRRYLAIVSGVPRLPKGRGRRPARPLAPEPQEDRDRQGRPWQAGGDPLEAAEGAARTRRWSNAGWKPAAPTRSASTWRRSAIRWSAIRSTAAEKAFTEICSINWTSSARRCTQRTSASSIRSRRVVCRLTPPFRRTCRNCSPHLVYRNNTARAARMPRLRE